MQYRNVRREIYFTARMILSVVLSVYLAMNGRGTFTVLVALAMTLVWLGRANNEACKPSRREF